jgi:alkylation response protein AidB-like acyl-CoA dehydrogenase
MNFDFSEEQKLLQKTARDYLDDHCGLDVCRSVLESGGTHSDALWKGVAEMGWLGAAVPEEYGGAGFGRLELALIAQELGRALAPIPFAPSVYLATEALLEFGSDAQKRAYLPRLVSGELVGTFALAERAGRSGAADVATSFAHGRLSGTKFPVLDGGIAGLVVVVAKGDSGPLLALAELDTAGVEVTPVGSIDPSRPQSRIVFDGAAAEPLANGAGEAAILHLLDRAAVLTAFEQIGGAERALEVTREFTLGRYAFGRPVASFQALKHRMVDLYAAIQLATSNAYYGAWALSTGAAELATAACSARIAASEAFDLAGKEIIQMHGGVGYTMEYDCHLFYRRAKLLSLSLGTPGEWRDRLIDRLEA